MKRGREEPERPMAMGGFYTPERPTGHHHHHQRGGALTPSTKRARDRSVPMDALSRLMTAAASAARMRKRAQGTLAALFGAHHARAPAMGSCTVCAASAATTRRPPTRLPTHELVGCAHCERVMGPCCQRQCDACEKTFCSTCSTLNCEEQFDRVFCLSCHDAR